MYHGLFIDDNVLDMKYAKSMQIDGDHGLSIEVLKPDKDIVSLADDIYEKNIDLLALDYRLDEIRSTPESPNRYKAGPLAQYIRDQAIDTPLKDFPIILVSQEENLIKYYLPDLTSHDLFDLVYSKSTLVKKNEQCRREMLSFVVGYKQIIEFLSSENRLKLLLNSRDEEDDCLDKQYLRQICGLNAPHQVARSLFKTVLNRPGLLVDNFELFARFGINPSSEDVPALIQILIGRGLAYTGVFSDGWQRWWSHRLYQFGEELCGSSLGELPGNLRVKCLNDHFGLNLKPAVSRWNNNVNALFSFACASCNSPTEIEFSVSSFDPIPLEYIQKKRICWKCIQTGEYKKHGLEVDESDRFIADKIENGKIVPEDQV